MGALQIPIGTFHRSDSGEQGSTVLNQSIRVPDFDVHTEFIPVSLRERTDLQAFCKVTRASGAGWLGGKCIHVASGNSTD